MNNKTRQFTNYLKKGTTTPLHGLNVIFGDIQAFKMNAGESIPLYCTVIADMGGILVDLCHAVLPNTDRNLFRAGGICGVVLSNNVILCNCDPETRDTEYYGNSLVGYMPRDWVAPALSFNCLSRFFFKKDKDSVLKTAKMLRDGRLELVHYTLDMRIRFTKAERRLRAKEEYHKMSPPGVGFTRTYREWHRPGSVLLRDTKTDKYYLLGQDEDMYFGCELVGKPKTINQAFIDLMPVEARGKEGVLRQGEWFAVPANKTDLPKLTKCVVFSKSRTVAGIALPVDHETSSEHVIRANELRVNKKGVVYVKDASVTHSRGEHSELVTKGWFSFHVNTAKRSFSEEGVD